jgi:hypothetical protein
MPGTIQVKKGEGEGSITFSLKIVNPERKCQSEQTSMAFVTDKSL